MEGQFLSSVIFGAGLVLRVLAALAIAGVGGIAVLPARRDAGLLIIAAGVGEAVITSLSFVGGLALPRLMDAGLGVQNYMLVSATLSFFWTCLSCCATGLLVAGLWKLVRQQVARGAA